MGKPGALRRLLRSCLPCSVHKHNKREVVINQGSNPNDDGEGVLLSLPQDIIFDVLSRLPVKTLCQLRCVSKTLRALISDPSFIAAQGFRAASAPLVMGVFSRPCPPLDKSYPLISLFKKRSYPPEPSLELRVIDSADGSVPRVVNDLRSNMLVRSNDDLVVIDDGIHGARFLRVDHEVRSNMLMRSNVNDDVVLIDSGIHGARVIDPSSGRATTIGGEPAPEEYPSTDYSGTRKIVMYNPYCSSTLGRASPSGAYKIVRIRDAWLRNGNGIIQICQIATLGLGDGIVMETTWRQRPEPPVVTRRVSVDSTTTTTAAGILHFLHMGACAHYNFPGPGPPSWNRIASFDLESEEWKETINGPSIGEPDEDESWDITIAVIRGSLCLVQNVVGPYSHYTSIWILVDTEKSTWVKQCTVQMPECLRYFNVLDILVDGRILMLSSFEIQWECRCILLLYCPRSGTYTPLMEMGEDLVGPLRLYTQSLLS